MQISSLPRAEQLAHEVAYCWLVARSNSSLQDYVTADTLANIPSTRPITLIQASAHNSLTIHSLLVQARSFFWFEVGLGRYSFTIRSLFIYYSLVTCSLVINWLTYD